MFNASKETQIIYKDISPYYKGKETLGYKSSINEDAIKNSLRNLFFISIKQVPGKPWMGNPLNLNLFENIDDFIKSAIEEAFINTIENYEPRVEIYEVLVDVDGDPNTITVNLKYYNLLEDKNLLKEYRFSTNYNTITNLTLREPV